MSAQAARQAYFRTGVGCVVACVRGGCDGTLHVSSGDIRRLVNLTVKPLGAKLSQSHVWGDWEPCADWPAPFHLPERKD